MDNRTKWLRAVRIWNRLCNELFIESQYGEGQQQKPSYFGGIAEASGLTSMLSANFFIKADQRKKHKAVASFLRQLADDLDLEP